MADRAGLSRRFLDDHGWGDASRHFLAGDASDRSYDRLIKGTERAVLMDAPPGNGDDPAQFVAVAAVLHSIGLAVPDILATDLDSGFLLLEDFGDAVFARVLEADPQREVRLYTTAVDALVTLQAAPPAPGLDDLSAQGWADAAMLVVDWYATGITGQTMGSSALRDTLTDALATWANGARVMIHRDFHAENLVWLPERSGVKAAGILDFQLLQLGQPAYDLVSLLQDARRDVTQATVTQAKRRFLMSTGGLDQELEAAYAVIGTQRALRIIGIFAKLALVSGKPHYLDLIPRVWRHLQGNLNHPALRRVRVVCDGLLPQPSDANLNQLRQKSGTVPA
jgi:N-acetylmuramate 1-kinase